VNAMRNDGLGLVVHIAHLHVRQVPEVIADEPLRSAEFIFWFSNTLASGAPVRQLNARYTEVALFHAGELCSCQCRWNNDTALAHGNFDADSGE
jgi:hypothetical protein